MSSTVTDTTAAAITITTPPTTTKDAPSEIRYIQYHSSLEKAYLPAIRALISKDLSEPYSIYVYRYFLYQWGELCFMVSLFLCLPLAPSLLPISDCLRFQPLQAAS